MAWTINASPKTTITATSPMINRRAALNTLRDPSGVMEHSPLLV
jgi:hypothetical protein